MALRRSELPFHRARKKMPCVDAAGKRVHPQRPNAIKFEKFIFDLLPAARNPLVVESAAAEAFAPVKNAAGEGTETVATAQAAMVQRDAALLRAAGIDVEAGVLVEINPRWALDVQDVREQRASGTRVTEPTYFHDE